MRKMSSVCASMDGKLTGSTGANVGFSTLGSGRKGGFEPGWSNGLIVPGGRTSAGAGRVVATGADGLGTGGDGRETLTLISGVRGIAGVGNSSAATMSGQSTEAASSNRSARRQREITGSNRHMRGAFHVC